MDSKAYDVTIARIQAAETAAELTALEAELHRHPAGEPGERMLLRGALTNRRVELQRRAHERDA